MNLIDIPQLPRWRWQKTVLQIVFRVIKFATLFAHSRQRHSVLLFLEQLELYINLTAYSQILSSFIAL